MAGESNLKMRINKDTFQKLTSLSGVALLKFAPVVAFDVKKR